MTLVNGRPARTIGVNDRGLLYGDGLFETVAVLKGSPAEIDRHLERLLNGCDRLGIVAPDVACLRSEIAQVCAGAARAVMKIIVTRGQGGRGYHPASQGEPTRIVTLGAWPEYPRDFYEHGIAACSCRTRLSRNPRLAGMKHLNRLEQILARGEWEDEYQEGLLMDTEGHVIEGTMSNLFMVVNGALHTPALEQAGVAGIMRARILEAAAGTRIVALVRDLNLDDIKTADAMFFCNSLIGIWPVRRFNGRVLGDHRLVRELRTRLGLP